MLSGLFSGRIGRLGFLVGFVYLQLPLFIAILAYAFINMLVGEYNNELLRAATNVFLFAFGAIWTVLYFLISIDLCVRRWHDINQTGWLVFLYVVPFASFVAAVVQLVVPGNPESNRYGAPVHGLGIKQVLFHKYATPVSSPATDAQSPPSPPSSTPIA